MFVCYPKQNKKNKTLEKFTTIEPTCPADVQFIDINGYSSTVIEYGQNIKSIIIPNGRIVQLNLEQVQNNGRSDRKIVNISPVFTTTQTDLTPYSYYGNSNSRVLYPENVNSRAIYDPNSDPSGQPNCIVPTFYAGSNFNRNSDCNSTNPKTPFKLNNAGVSVTTLGNFKVDSLNIDNDSINSICIPSGYKVTVYEDDIGSNSTVFTNNQSNLSAIGWGNKISSFNIYKNFTPDPPGQPTCTVPTFFAGSYFNANSNPNLNNPGTPFKLNNSGVSVTTLGIFGFESLSSSWIENDSINSICIPPGYKVTVYDDDIGSNSTDFTENQSNLSAIGWGNKISAFIISYRQPTTMAPNTTRPNTIVPNTTTPNTMAPDTMAPDTMAPDTMAPDTMAPDTMAPSTMAPNTMAPSTMAPSTMVPNTMAPDTMVPNTMAPNTMAPNTMAPSTMTPNTMAPNTMIPSTMAPNTMAPSTMAPNTMAPSTMAPSTMAPNTMAPNTMAPNTTQPILDLFITKQPNTTSSITTSPNNSQPPNYLLYGGITAVILIILIIILYYII